MRWVLALLLAAAGTAWADPATVRVMSFNLWYGGQAGGQPLKQSAEVIAAADANIVGLQETHGKNGAGNQTEALAALLHWNYLEQADKTSILTPFNIVRPLDDLGAEVELPDGRRVLVFNIHYYHAPYQPYQLLSIPYEDGRFIKTEDEAIDEARKARGGESDQLAAVIKRYWDGDLPIFVTGDFNEPSHLDWTPKAASAGVVPLAVTWPASKALTDIGLIDAYRATHANEASKPGFTWTPITAPDDPNDRHDRIDFVYAAGPLRVLQAAIVGELPEFANIVVTPYPSDHRAVVAECAIADAGE
jgi:endonuclease/exonuclease/phosphatase family metal-dependent hydrolase